jgi:UDP-3-O-acyl-N-acetylglucosamine deacetylase
MKIKLQKDKVLAIINEKLADLAAKEKELAAKNADSLKQRQDEWLSIRTSTLAMLEEKAKTQLKAISEARKLLKLKDYAKLSTLNLGVGGCFPTDCHSWDSQTLRKEEELRYWKAVVLAATDDAIEFSSRYGEYGLLDIIGKGENR